MGTWTHAVVLVAVVLAGSRDGCTVGCRPQPQTLFVAGPDIIPLKRVGPCTFHIEGQMFGPFPSYDDGFYGVVVNDLAENDIHYDPIDGTLALREPACSQWGVRTMELWHYRFVRTVNR